MKIETDIFGEETFENVPTISPALTMSLIYFLSKIGKTETGSFSHPPPIERKSAIIDQLSNEGIRPQPAMMNTFFSNYLEHTYGMMGKLNGNH